MSTPAELELAGRGPPCSHPTKLTDAMAMSQRPQPWHALDLQKGLKAVLMSAVDHRPLRAKFITFLRHRGTEVWPWSISAPNSRLRRDPSFYAKLRVPVVPLAAAASIWGELRGTRSRSIGISARNSRCTAHGCDVVSVP